MVKSQMVIVGHHLRISGFRTRISWFETVQRQINKDCREKKEHQKPPDQFAGWIFKWSWENIFKNDEKQGCIDNDPDQGERKEGAYYPCLGNCRNKDSCAGKKNNCK